jgi:hypothetical protein
MRNIVELSVAVKWLAQRMAKRPKKWIAESRRRCFPCPKRCHKTSHSPSPLWRHSWETAGHSGLHSWCCTFTRKGLVSLTDKVRQLALSISRCSEIAKACKDDAHPCSRIVSSQGVFGQDFRQVPEAWAGDLSRAKVMFVSSNPSISTPLVPGTGEDYPLAHYEDPTIEHPRWSTERLIDFQVNRLDQSREVPLVTINARYLCQDGLHRGSDKPNGTNSSQRYWKTALQQSRDLLGADFDMSHDICMTEIVHCKSKNEIGVNQALHKCASNYLAEVLNLSNAELILIGGWQARDLLQGLRRTGHTSWAQAWDISELFGLLKGGKARPEDHVGLVHTSSRSRIVIATQQLSYASNKFRFVRTVIGDKPHEKLQEFLRSTDRPQFVSRDEVCLYLGLS